jgi:hypothetical protein
MFCLKIFKNTVSQSIGLCGIQTHGLPKCVIYNIKCLTRVQKNYFDLCGIRTHGLQKCSFTIFLRSKVFSEPLNVIVQLDVGHIRKVSDLAAVLGTVTGLVQLTIQDVLRILVRHHDAVFDWSIIRGHSNNTLHFWKLFSRSQARWKDSKNIWMLNRKPRQENLILLK